MIKKGIVLLSLALLVTGCSEGSATTSSSSKDIIQKGTTLTNQQALDTFIKHTEEHKEDHIRVIRHYGKQAYEYGKWQNFGLIKENGEPIKGKVPEGKVIYDLTYRYDKQAKQGWIEVKSDTSQFKESTEYPATIAENQQCSRIDKDSERGYYLLTECFHRWDYELFPL